MNPDAARENRLDSEASRWGGIKRFLPWLSLSWGLVSALLMSRDFAHSIRIVLFFIGLVFVSIALGVWFSVRKKIESWNGRGAWITQSLAKRSRSVEWAGFATLQASAQYILFFSLPFLYFSNAWWLGAVVVALTVSTLWDPWWERLVRTAWYWALVRTISALLASSLIISVFVPFALAGLNIFLALVAPLAAVPWSMIWMDPKERRALPVGVRFGKLVVPAFALLFSAATLSGTVAVPPLGIWLRSAEIGSEIVDRKLSELFSGTVNREAIQRSLAEGRSICCLTPVVAARGVSLELVHEWQVDGRRVDTISLGAVHGLDDSAAFRTFSCKRAVPNLETAKALRCRARLASGVELGSVAVWLR